MAADEKNPLIGPVRAKPHETFLRVTRDKRRVVLLSMICLAGIYAFSWCSPSSRGSTPEIVSDQCPQVAPLIPSQSSPALDKMDLYLDSAEFRNRSIRHLSGAIQVPTESFDDMSPVGEDQRWEVFVSMAAYLEKTFPLVHKTLQLERVNTHGLLFTWQGSDDSLKPTVLMAHQDVVPVDKSTIGQWTHPPFSGDFDGKFIWGRGSSDCKTILIGVFEAVEQLIAADYKPRRTLLLSFGFDEEISGGNGAGHLAPFLVERYGKNGAAVIVDEGTGSLDAWGMHFSTPATAEKGYMDVDIVIRMPGGHSSAPPDHNGIGVMSELVTLIEGNPYEPHVHPGSPFLGLLQCGAQYGHDFPEKLKKLLPLSTDTAQGGKDELSREAAKLVGFARYMFTTSSAVDIVHGGVKANMLPERTTATVNHRINIGSNSSDIEAHLTVLATTLANKYNLTIHAFSGEEETPSSITLTTRKATLLEPSPITPSLIDRLSPYYVVSGTSRALYGEKNLVAPGTLAGFTDTRHYWDLTKHIFRYGAGWDSELKGATGVHTVNEHTSIVSHINEVKWLSMFVRNMDEAELD